MNPRVWLLLAGVAFSGSSSAHAAGSHPPHRGESPWSFTTVDTPSSRFVVNDTDSSTIDVYLLRSQGPIVIEVPIRRYVGPTDAEGYLLNLQQLKANGVVGDTVSLTVPAYDVDETTPPNADCDGDRIIDTLIPEVDELFLNDERIGVLTGRNNSWARNVFTVPIEQVRFPSHPGEIGRNEFRVEIDTGNRNIQLSSGAIGCDRWAVTIDWIGLKFDAASPVVMVHGIQSSGRKAFLDFREGLQARHLWANDLSIELLDETSHGILPPGCASSYYNDSIASHVVQLRSLVPEIAERFGSETLHFVAHSKGGLDTLGFLSDTIKRPLFVQVGTMNGVPVTRALEGRSLVTLGTPYGGSVLAEYGVEARQLRGFDAVRAGGTAVVARLFEGAYYCDLTPARAASFVANTTLPASVQWASVAVDADCNGDGQLRDRDTCGSGETEAQGFLFGEWAANALYRLVGRVYKAVIEVTPVRSGLDVVTVRLTPTATFQENDALVTKTSASRASRYPIDGWNHTNVHSTSNGEVIAENAQAEGLVSWRLR